MVISIPNNDINDSAVKNMQQKHAAATCQLPNNNGNIVKILEPVKCASKQTLNKDNRYPITTKATLIVLLWKQGIVRLSRFLHTGIEWSSTTLFFIILFFLKNELMPPTSTYIGECDNVKSTEEKFMEEYKTPRFILYTPPNNVTNQLMAMTAKILQLENNTYNLEHSVRGYYPAVNDASIMNYMKGMKDDEAIVIFQNNGSFPWKLNYTIRMKTPFQTNIYESMDGSFVPHMQFGTVYESFAKLQWAIDKSYLEMRTGDTVNQTITMQEFPFVSDEGNEYIELICTILTITCFVSLVLVFVFLISRLVEERISGIQELMKMIGVSSYLLGISHIIFTLPGGLAYSFIGTIVLTTTPNPYVAHSTFLLIYLALLLHFFTVIAMAFAASYIARNSQYVVTVAVFTYVVLWIPSRLLSNLTMDWRLLWITGLLPHMPCYWFWEELGKLEAFGQGVTLSTMMSSHSIHSAPVFVGFLLMILQCFIFFALAWYLNHVLPGKYGHAKPWNFIFKHCGKKVDPTIIYDDEMVNLKQFESEYFENSPMGIKPGIKIDNVSKNFQKTQALKDVSFNAYEGEITVLLGQNGAGKTTLMSIITGMMSASSGKVYVNGNDTTVNHDEVRRDIGLCPQHNLFFTDLTVLKHVVFFFKLKGYRSHKAYSDAEELLKNLGLEEKLHSGVTELSGGMKRRVQLACALAGGSSVLVLDEPTSGLDVETRRALWDQLLSLRGSRTVLLTTHFLEEADALADRVALLTSGHLCAYATPMFLKKAIGSGYRLSLTFTGDNKRADVENIITSHVKDAAFKQESFNTIIYDLPSKDSDKFAAMFNALEGKREELNIKNIGVGVTNLEEVFLKLSAIEKTPAEDETDGNAITPIKIDGFRLWARQFSTLFKRQVKYIISKKYSFLLLQIILPILLICIFTRTYNDEVDQSSSNMARLMNLELYNKMVDKRALYNVDMRGQRARTDVKLCCGTTVEQSTDIIGDIIRIGKEDKLEYNKYLIGIEINDTDAKILYTTTVRHAVPVAMNAFSNVLAMELLRTNEPIISTYNHPIEDEDYHHRIILQHPKSQVMTMAWALTVLFIIQASCINFVSLPSAERISGARHIHVMSGCPPPLYWLTSLAAHMSVTLFGLVLPALAAAAALDTDHTLHQPSLLWAFAVILFLGSLSFFAIMYLISFNFNEKIASVLLIGLLILFGCMTPSIKNASEMLSVSQARDAWYYAARLAGALLPPHAATEGALRAAQVARLNAYCHLNRHRCPRLLVPDNGFDAQRCCEKNQNPRCYFCIDDFSPGAAMITLFLQFIVYMSLVLAMEYGLFNILKDRLFNWRTYFTTYTGDEAELDPKVRAEEVTASNLINNQHSDKAIVVYSIHKRYPKTIGRSCHAVKGISFVVEKGKCFGLLGVNGAGKSTTFKMLSAEECVSHGQVRIGHTPLSRWSTQPSQQLSYCPQFFGLDEFLTGRENLELLLILRGFNDDDIEREVQHWIDIVGLSKYADVAVSMYSGGCVRRLGAAATLAGGAPLALLDEPSAGVDPAARRRLHRALRRALARRRALLVTSHSMDEMEALCDRIGIMSEGTLKALDTPTGLRASHATGHTLVLKLRPDAAAAATTATISDADGEDSSLLNKHSDETDGREVNNLKEKLGALFSDNVPTDEHKTMLRYRITETRNYSELFDQLEQLKSSCPIIEDYSITETTLEEVFLSFAKNNKSNKSDNPV
ncbi:retinal-specific phospholipid-transporting ATPase ABCA4-like isoform X2 [Galleria mellonella]|uniref:Retinal-specific phospholipid-transporting ATPase ABCA4-like isoform X2 n=1 Tax=Galleria mellonella TaxID=7137 RepID=A0ABM3MX74_GALME|nr:retinal-specific phospholipid-transporting ATPase ABCA4-like isoform X2 [Galleria mellonella]